MQPLSGEFGGKRFGSWIRKHPPHLLFEYQRVPEFPAGGDGQQRFVGSCVPEEVRQSRGEFKVADPESVAGLYPGRSFFKSKHEVETSEDCLQAKSDSGFKVSTLATFLEESHQAFHVIRGYGPPVRLSG